jgi:hypothetical protein
VFFDDDEVPDERPEVYPVLEADDLEEEVAECLDELGPLVLSLYTVFQPLLPEGPLFEL